MQMAISGFSFNATNRRERIFAERIKMFLQLRDGIKESVNRQRVYVFEQKCAHFLSVVVVGIAYWRVLHVHFNRQLVMYLFASIAMLHLANYWKSTGWRVSFE